MTDLASSMYATVGILLALYQREKTGRGQAIDISMFESAVSWLQMLLFSGCANHEAGARSASRKVWRVAGSLNCPYSEET